MNQRSKLVQKLNASFLARIVVYIVVGFIVSAALCAILIAVGHFSLASSSALSYQVTFFGLPIYEILKSGNSLVGHAVGTNMMFIGIGCVWVLMLITELVLALKRKNKRY